MRRFILLGRNFSLIFDHFQRLLLTVWIGALHSLNFVQKISRHGVYDRYAIRFVTIIHKRERDPVREKIGVLLNAGVFQCGD